MASAWQRTAKLDEVLCQVNNYHNKSRVRNDVAVLLQNIDSLQPCYQAFSGQGTTVHKFFLSGVLKVPIRGQFYNIPVTIYLDEAYPQQAPRCFVTPSAGMDINPSQHVDAGGMVKLPYISNWNQYNSTLPELVQLMINVFSQNSPVYRTPPGQATQQRQQATQGYAQATPIATPTALPNIANQTVQARPISQAQHQPTQRELAVKDLTGQAQQKWPALLGGIVNDINEQQKKKADLQEYTEKVAAELKSLQEKTENNKEKQQELEAMERDLEAFVTANAGKEPNPDDIQAELDQNSKLVLDLLSEELAMEEYLLTLDELLEARKLSIDTFLAEVRDVSREQFKVKVMRQKAAKDVRNAAAAQSTGQALPQAQVVSVQPQRVAVAA